MKILFSAVCAIFLGAFFLTASPVSARGLLGARECTWGPSYWCSNITNAKGCNAVRHCIQTVWEKQTVPEDHDSICQICLDMVKQARDQLESNETQSDLKAVFEGSCRLIPLKPVQKECIKLADNFIPEMVEALASQMNPQVVCSVAGLCNNEAIDKMLAEMPITKRHDDEPLETESVSNNNENKKLLSCSGCSKISSVITKKFTSTSRDDFLENLLRYCGHFGSFSDACSNIVISYFNDIYDQISEDMNAENICHLSGVCSAKYHDHPEIVEIRPMSAVGVVPHKEDESNDDIPCELCEQLIRHMRDVLIANTTESEFKQVMEGLCKQTKGFKDECLSIVDQYYDIIYHTLVDNLDENGICFAIGVCSKRFGKINEDVIIAPLLPIIPPAEVQVTIKKKLLGENEPKLSHEEIQSMQLPIDKLMGAPLSNTLVQNGELCTLCEYFLHFVQEALATPANADKIKEAVGVTCDKFPTSVRAECHNFVDVYGDMVIALLIHGMDPRQVCPEIKLCPQNIVADMEVFAPKPIESVSISTHSEQDKPTCPLCLFAVTQAQEMIKSDKTKQRVEEVLDNLCTHFSNQKIKKECIDFVNSYSAELIQMLITDFTPQQICVYIKLCQESSLGLPDVNINIENDEDIETNDIADNTINGKDIYYYDVGNAECVLCQKIVKSAMKRVVNKKSKDEIEKVLEQECERIHSIKSKCRAYIEKYGDKIAELIIKEAAPKEICHLIQLCSVEFDDLEIDEALKVDIIALPSDTNGVVKLNKMTSVQDTDNVGDSQLCVLCEFVMARLEQELKDKKTEDEIKNTIHGICKKMPNTVKAKCDKFVEQYADIIIALVDTMPPKEICSHMNLCFSLENHAHEEIVECGVCHGAVMALQPIIKENPNVQNQEMIDQACENVPAKYYGRCSDLIAYYGESIANLIKSETDQREICSEIGKCYLEERPIESYLRIGGVMDFSENHHRERRAADKLVGAEKCTWGPSYWCDNEANAVECKTKSWCTEKKMGFAATKK